LWTLLAHNQGSVLNQARIASALGIANPTVDRYIGLLGLETLNDLLGQPVCGLNFFNLLSTISS